MSRDVIGTAYVRISAMSSDFEKQVQRSFDKLKPMAEKSGKDGGAAYADGWDKGLKERMQQGQRKALEDMHVQSAQGGRDGGQVYGQEHADAAHDVMVGGNQKTLDRLGKDSASAGTTGGRDYGLNWRSEVIDTMGKSINDSQNLWRNSHLMRYSLEDLQGLARDMPDILGGASDDSGRTMRQRLSGHFNDIGSDLQGTFAKVGQGVSATFSDIFKGGSGGGRMWKSLTDGADQASEAFTVFFSIAQLGGAALVGLVASIANVASALFGLVAAAGQAAPALAVIPGLISAIAQAGLTMVIGFKGLGKAISEGMKFADSSMSGTTQRAKELQTAQRGVANASRAVQSAETSALRAKKELKNAQDGLNEAYKEGAKQLRDIQYAAEDAALQEERSAINLANARDELLQTRGSNPADSRAVQEAELAYKEADLAYREARSRNKDASTEAADATKKGVKGTQAVVSAQDRLVSAQENVASSNQRLADSQLALADAQKNLADTQKGNTGVMKAYNDALKKFGPEGQKFIKTVIKMQGQFRGLKQAAGEGAFKAMNVELTQFAAGPLFGILEKNFARTSTAIGGVITRFSDMLQAGDNMSSIDRIMKSNTVVIGSMGEVATNLGQAFISITDAARPMTQEFARWVAKVTAGWAATLKADNASGKLTKKFEKASKVAKQLGRIFRNLWEAISGTAGAANSGGGAKILLDDLEAATKKWSEWVKSVTGNKQLQDYFVNVAKGFKPLMEGVNAVVKALLKLGGNTATVTAIGDSLKAIAGVIGPIGDAVDRVAPKFTEFSTAISEIFTVLQESGSLEYFIKVLTGAAKAIATVLKWIVNLQGIENPFGEGKIFTGKQIIFFVGAIMGVVRALRILQKVFGFLGKATLGKMLLNLSRGFKGLRSILGGKSLFSGVTKSSEEVRKEFKKQMLVDRLKKQALAGVGEGAEIATDELGRVDKASRKSRAFKAVGKGIKGVGRGGKALLGAFRPTPDNAFDGIPQRSRVQQLLNEGRGRRARAALDGQQRPGFRARAGGLIRDRISRARGNDGSFIGRRGGQDDDEDTPRTRRSSRLKGIGSKVGGATKRVGGALKGGLGKGVGLIGTAVSAIKLISSLNATSAGELGDTITGMLKNLPTALSALAGQVPKVISAIAAALGPMISSIVKALPGIMDSIVKALPGILSTISAALPKILDAIVKVLPIIFAGIATALPKILDAVANMLPNVIDALAALFPKIIDMLVKLFPKIIEVLAKAIPKVIGALTKALPKVIGALAKAIPAIITALAAAIPLIIQALATAIPQIIDALTTALPVIITALAGAIPMVIKALVAAIPVILKALTNALPLILNSIVTALPIIIKAVVDAIPIIITALVDAIPVIIDAFITALPLIIDALIKALPLIIGAFIGAIPQIIGALIKGIPQIVGALITALPKIFGALAKAIGQVLVPIGDFFGKALESVKTGISTSKKWIEDKWGEIISFFQGLPAKIGRAVSGMWDGVKTAFKGVINWVLEKWNDLSLGITVPDNFITSALGIANLRFALDTPNISPLASGGTVAARAGGSLALLGEAGRNEVVKPLDGRGFTASDRAIVEMMRAQKSQMDKLVAALVGTTARAQASGTATAAVTAAQRAVSTGGGGSATNSQVATAINHLTDSVDALQKPLVGGDLNVVSAPNEWASESIPRTLRRRAYVRGRGAR